MKTIKILGLIFIASFSITSHAFSQESPDANHQIWTYAYLNWRLNDKWVYNQDFGYQHSYGSPIFTRIFTRSQINRQLSGAVSLHGGINFIYKINKSEYNAFEIRPWAGAKLRWPYFWRLNFVQDLKFEQRFEFTGTEKNWDNNFRFRYKISSNVPINHAALVDNTLYGIAGYEFFSVSFGDDLRFTTAATHRFELGLGFQQNIKNRYEFVVLGYMSRDENSDQYNFSDIVFFMKYKRYIHWE